MNEEFDPSVSAQVVLYHSDGANMPVEVTYWDETFWLTQQKMAELFGTSQQNISLHLKNIYATNELQEESTHKDFLSVRQEGSRTVRRAVAFYNLDAIIAVGYRVNSIQATRFRQWATGVLREYTIKGFVLDDDMLKNGRPFGKDYFDELLVRIRDIRASERRVWQKITDIFQDVSSDYDPNSQTARNFFATVQNKMHYAASGHTAAEIISSRVDSRKPHMGLTTWKGAPSGRIHSSDVTVAKNYLSHDEIDHLNQLVGGLLDALELRARNHQLTSMAECAALVDQYVTFTGGRVLQDRGHVQKRQADRKALDEFRKFNETQENDFEKFIRHVEDGK